MACIVVKGKLESAERYGIFRDIKLIVDGSQLYDRTLKSNIVPKDAENKIGKYVVVTCEETKIKSMDYLLDLFFGLGTRPPQTYNQVLEVRVLE